MKKKTIGFCIMLSVVLACSSTQEITEPNVDFQIPKNFPQPIYNLARNPITKAGFELGKALFSDPILSRNNSISCSECHAQSYAFTHHGHDVSHGIDNLKGTRNALAMQNLAWQSEFFWDGGVGDLDFVPLAPIENPVEMDEKVGNVLEKLRKTQYYPAQFKKAFGTNEINAERFLKALSQYMLTLVSANSRYDKYVRNEGEILTADELAGLSLFKQKCASCHKGELFTDQSYRNNGLTIQGDMDTGRFRITEQPQDKYKFKVPSLRNIEVSKPYMHDGRFYTLETVLDHYAEGVQQTPNLDPLLQNGIPMTAKEKLQIVAFLKTLTDEQFLKDKRLSN
jgi:cytochrome c peroxidase